MMGSQQFSDSGKLREPIADSQIPTWLWSKF